MPSLASRTDPSQTMAFRPLHSCRQIRLEDWARRAKSPHSTECILHLDIPDLLVSMAFHFFQQLTLCRDDFFEGGFEIGLGDGRVGSECLGSSRYDSGLSVPLSALVMTSPAMNGPAIYEQVVGLLVGWRAWL